jgi:hypothetical protein
VRGNWGERTSGDLSSLLVELGRVLKGLYFYRDDHPARRALLDRAFLAWQVELDRAGPIELRVEEPVLKADGVHEAIALDSHPEVAAALRACDVRRLRLTPDLTRAAFDALAELLSLDAEAVEARGGLAVALAARDRTGIAIDGDELEGVPPTPRTQLRKAPPHPRERDETKPSLERDPLEAPASDARDEELRLRLRELDECIDDDRYTRLAGELSARGQHLAGAGIGGAWYRVVLVLSDHAAGQGGRSGTQASVAESRLRELATGPVLAGIIDRACDPAASVSVRAAQILLQLGDCVVPTLLERIDADTHPGRGATLSGLVIALGERAGPTLVSAIEEGRGSRAKLAVRLAGELQSRILVPTLKNVLRGDSSPLRREAAKALVHIAGPEAVDALVQALASPDEQLPEMAAGCLGELGSHSALPALLSTLDRAVAEGRHALAREVVRALAGIGSGAAVPKLVSILERRDLFRRRRQGELKLAAIGALASLRGREALRALERASRDRDPRVRRMAQQVLSRSRRRASERPKRLK